MFFLRCGHQLAKTEGPLVPGRSFGLQCRTILFLVLCFLPGGFFLSGEGFSCRHQLDAPGPCWLEPQRISCGHQLDVSSLPPGALPGTNLYPFSLPPPPKPSGLVVGINLMSRPWPGASPKFSGCGHQLDVLSPCSGRSDTPSQLFSSPLPCLGLLGKSTEGPFVLPPWTVLPPPGLRSPWQIHFVLPPPAPSVSLANPWRALSSSPRGPCRGAFRRRHMPMYI